uniref:Uncharacterized protein n=1 Tax=Panagrolaimus sp. ES5 TaxID=591445 RepID=A0AC34GQW6_9BILA
MVDLKFLCFLFFVFIAANCAHFKYINLECMEMDAIKYRPVYENLSMAVKACSHDTYRNCVGVRQSTDENEKAYFWPYYKLKNVKKASTSNDYLYDRSNGTILPKLPNDLDSKLFFSIYIETCPEEFQEYGNICRYAAVSFLII